MLNVGVVEELHAKGIAGSDDRNVGVCGAAERAQVAAEVVVVGGQIVEGVGELGGHVVLSPGGLTDVLPVLGSFAIEDELAEDVVGSSRANQANCSCRDDGKVLHCGS